MELRLIHLYPDLMSLYGSYANLSILKRYLEGLGNTVQVEAVAPGGEADLSGADFLFMGAGTERAQKAALADFLRFGPTLKDLAKAGMPMLFAGNAMELLGASITCRRLPAGSPQREAFYECIGLAGFTTVQEPRRLTGDVYGHTELYPEAVVGFMNKCGVVFGVETPLLSSVEMGWGNEGQGSPEGFHWKNVFASELTGPILVKNPRLLEAAAAAVYGYRGETFPPERPRDTWAEQGFAVTAEQLRLRCEK